MPNCTVNGNAGLHLGSERILKEGNNVFTICDLSKICFPEVEHPKFEGHLMPNKDEF